MEPEYYCRAPGRVNITGNHLDYQGYSCLPTAIEQDFVIAYAKVTEGEGSDMIVVDNMQPELYTPVKTTNDPFQPFKDDPVYINYFLCGYKAMLAHNEALRTMVPKPCGLKIVIDSWVPPAAGLSSSSAMTVCSAMATAHANGILDKIPR